MRITRSLLLAVGMAVCLSPVAEARSLSGSYLAAQQAQARSDHAEAAYYYTQALGFDPANGLILRHAMQAHVAAGDVAVAAAIADRLLALNTGNQFATLVAMVDDLTKDQAAQALARLDMGAEGMTPLLSDLLRAWVELELGADEQAFETFASIGGSQTLEMFGRYHEALALALRGDYGAASDLLENSETGAIRLNRRSTLTRVQLLSITGQRDAALELVEQVLSTGFGDRQFETIQQRLQAGEQLDFTIISSAQEGIAEVFFDLASVLNEDTGDVALIYSRLSNHLDPDMAEGLLLTGDLLSRQDQHGLASEVFDAVGATAPQFVEAEIGRADALDAAGNEEEAIGVLSGLTRSHPDMLRPHYLLGRALRRAERPEEAIATLDQAVALIDAPEQRHWLVWYQRGISYDHSDNWPAAEEDLRAALALDPENALILNYLGYSLVERGGDLDEALEMIERAVEARPFDGYITDSLAWVLYRMGRFEEAVEPMERALELAPVDPTLNDHLGDIYWTVGRYREAEFQWHRALSFEPEDDVAERIRLKLDIGLDEVLALEAEQDAEPAEQSEASVTE